GHPLPLEYQGAPVPKKMNELGYAGKPVAGSLLTPDPVDETAALDQARTAAHGNGRSGDGRSGDGHADTTGDGERAGRELEARTE
ncbi:MAG: cytochrome b, partial [Thermocrispum sp.]